MRSRKLFAATVALIAAQTIVASAQRPSQFSFPSGPAAASFGSSSDSLFGNINVNNNNQDQSQPSSSSAQSSSSSQFVPIGLPSQTPSQSSGSSSQPDQSQLVASSQSSNAGSGSLRQQAASEQQAAANSVQLSRPSLSLSQSPNQSQSSSRQPQSSSSSASQRGTQSASRHAAQASHHAPATAPALPVAIPARHHQAATSPKHQHPANMHPQATSQSGNPKAQENALDAARKAEATAASLAASSGQSYVCPDSFGYFRHHKSCDKYWACENGTSTLKLCGNGLMFDDSDPKRENCAYPFSVDCGADRTDLEPPISTPHCPRLYGLFADNTNCRVFYSCWNGESSKYECPPGLAYDNEQRVCVWADHVDRCDQSEVSDGFVCPDPTEVDQPGHYTRHAHPTDCRKFYVCIEGVARPYGCSFGTVFNVDSLQCDEPENVSGCEKYYGDIDPKLAKKLARENSQSPAQRSPSERSSSSSSSRGATSNAADVN